MLYLVPTPIGNLEDMTLRAIRVLKEVDRIFAEDTRHTMKLLNHFDIHTPLQSCHQHNEREAAEKIIKMLQNGATIALVSDAGLPGISDPGHLVVQRVIAEGLAFTVLPGASAATTALIYSGLACNEFVFAGFLSRIKKERRRQIELLQSETRTTIFYESPHRMGNTLKELAACVDKNRMGAVCRELTKVHEECQRGTLDELALQYQENVKGECVFLIEGTHRLQAEENSEDLLEQMQQWIEQGKKPKEAAKLIATQQHSANELYQAYIKKKKEEYLTE